MPTTLSLSQNRQSPFFLEDDTAYQLWRDDKMQGYPTNLNALVVDVKNPCALSILEKTELASRLSKTNIAIYAGGKSGGNDRHIPHAIAAQIGISKLNHNWLADKDGLTSLTVQNDGARQHFIPYSNRLIHWHTDGYYNKATEQIQSLILHCVRPAITGGENRLLDHEMAYILLRDENPDYIRALMMLDVMTIPARTDKDGQIVRQAETGPVFTVRPDSGKLHMRYTARKHNIVWKDDTLTQQALSFLKTMLESTLPYIYQGRLEAGMGLVCTNVLHDRSGFEDNDTHKRLLYRARYFDRINLQDQPSQ